MMNATHISAGNQETTRGKFLLSIITYVSGIEAEMKRSSEKSKLQLLALVESRSQFS